MVPRALLMSGCRHLAVLKALGLCVAVSEVRARVPLGTSMATEPLLDCDVPF